MLHHYKVGYSCSWKLSVFFFSAVAYFANKKIYAAWWGSMGPLDFSRGGSALIPWAKPAGISSRSWSVSLETLGSIVIGYWWLLDIYMRPWDLDQDWMRNITAKRCCTCISKRQLRWKYDMIHHNNPTIMRIHYKSLQPILICPNWTAQFEMQNFCSE